MFARAARLEVAHAPRPGGPLVFDETRMNPLSTSKSRRAIVRTGVKLAYATPLVAASTKLGIGGSAALSGGNAGVGMCDAEGHCPPGFRCSSGYCVCSYGSTAGGCNDNPNCQCATNVENVALCFTAASLTNCSALPECTTSEHCFCVPTACGNRCVEFCA
jgi:hypothetical protein